MDVKTKALNMLMPLGGWSLSGDEVTIHEDGLAHGYGVPSQGEIDSALTVIEHNEPILAQLSELDKYVSRETEDLIITTNTDSFLVEKANKKKELRGNLL